MFEEIIVENFPKMEKEIANQVQETQSPIQDKTKEKHTKTHLIKLTNTNHKERLLKAEREKKPVT